MKMSCLKTHKILFLLVLSFISINFQCNKNLNCRETVYSFESGIKAYPDQDSINIGDTLWLEVNQTVNLKDLQTNETVNYSNASNFGTALSFAQLMSVDSTNDKVASKFRYVLIYGNEIQREDKIKYREYNFYELNGYYRFKLGLIPNEKGIFKLFISNSNNVLRTNDNCTKANFQIDFIDTDQHFYLNKVSFPDVNLSGKNGVYLFKVK